MLIIEELKMESGAKRELEGINMSDYISPILGVIPEEVYNHVVTFKVYPYITYSNIMRREFGFGRLRSGILWLETEFDEPREFIGAELNAFLINNGFPSSVSSDLVRTFAANQTLIDDIVERGFNVKDVVYGLNLKERLSQLGLTTRAVTTSFAFESIFTIFSVTEVEELPPPPPEFERWKTFLVSMLIDCETGDRGKRIKRVIEFRGTFTARSDVIVDWKAIAEGGDPEDVIKDAVEVAEAVIEDYSFLKGYEFLFECSRPTFNGLDLKEDLPGILVDVDASDFHETTTLLEVVDRDYGDRIPYSDKIKYTGYWWEDKSKAITEMRRQVTEGPGAGQYKR